MPLLKGKKNIGHNIKEMEMSGHSKAQSIAASLNEARKSRAKIKPKGEHMSHHKKEEKKEMHHKKETKHHETKKEMMHEKKKEHHKK